MGHWDVEGIDGGSGVYPLGWIDPSAPAWAFEKSWTLEVCS